MKKIDIFQKDLKKQLKAASKDKIYRFLLKNGQLRGVLISCNKMINEMRANHELGILETLILGHGYIAAGLLSANLKGNDRISLDIKCSGPAKGLSVESNANGEVRGYLKAVPIPVDKPPVDFNTSPFIGAGFLEITKYLEDAKQPYTGQVMIEYGNLAQDLACYFTKSEQTPTSFVLSIQFDREGNVKGAGGLFLQAMPGAEPDVVGKIEETVSRLPSLGLLFSEGTKPEDFIKANFQKFQVNIIDRSRVEFYCRCNEKSMTAYVSMLPSKEISSILEEGSFPLEIRCHNCSTVYTYTEHEIRNMQR